MLINLGIFVATVVAAIIAWKGVNESIQARDASEEHEKAALAAAKDSAEALAKQADLAENTLEFGRRAERMELAEYMREQLGRTRHLFVSGDASGHPYLDGAKARAGALDSPNGVALVEWVEDVVAQAGLRSAEISGDTLKERRLLWQAMFAVIDETVGAWMRAPEEVELAGVDFERELRD